MDYRYTTNYTKTTLISSLSLIAIIAFFLSSLAILDIMKWNDVYEVVWRTGAVLALGVVLSAVTGLLVDWSKSSK